MSIRWGSAGAALAAAGLFIALLWPVIRTAAPETDLWWMLPLMRDRLQGRPLWEGLGFLFSPGPILLGQPLLKIFLAPAGIWGWSVPMLIGVAIGFHLLNAWLVGSVGQLLGLSRWVSRSAAAVYLSCFAHFHSFFWPTAFHHLVAVFTILGVLWLYLKTEEGAAAARPGWRGLFALTLAAGAAASLERSAILVPILILWHLLVVSRSPEERRRRFDRWMPFFLLFMIYPAFALAFVGDPFINNVIVRLPIPPWVRVAILIGPGIAVLFLLRALLRRRSPWPWRRILWTAVPALWVALFLKDHRQVLLPYNLMVPWAAIWASFLDPFGSALAVKSTEPFHYLTGQISLFSMGFSALGVGIFLRVFAAEKRGLWLWPVWYGVCLIHILHHYSSFPIRIPSRYFVYLSPLFAWVFCAVGWWAADRLGKRAGWSERVRGAVWVLALAAFCLTNLMAIRLAIFRGKMANTYLVYEELRAEDPPTAGERPFLLRYLLGDCRLSDVRWITDGRGLRGWLDELEPRYRSWPGIPNGTGERVRAAMDQELLGYAVGLVERSAAERERGRPDSARKWLSQLYFLEPDPDRLKDWLAADERISGSPKALSDTWVTLKDPAAFGDPLPWRKDDYGFGRFMMRLILGWDIRSRYDRISLVP